MKIDKLISPGIINDELVNFHLGTYQLEALHICHNAEQSWVSLNTLGNMSTQIDDLGEL